MRAFLDACVLYPTVLREILIGVAGQGLFTPLWSARVLEEWARATVKLGQEEIARAEIAALRRDWPLAEVMPDPEAEARLWLPDPADRHVLAAALAGGAEVIVTQNLRDFPRAALGAEGMRAEAPDAFLLGLWHRAPGPVAEVVEAVRATAERLSGEPQPLRPLMKRARLPRLGKALSR
ncbi:RSP_2648 family PIN domain-containing protein [Plastorhodobacter daqingensis]|uniref:RSP_2648 family PIN domain-containing protein n=1 Tax=Plastorhodobacter daqingensis TaxID=1387281 RepID=A0ABW2UPG2_9RHOB